MRKIRICKSFCVFLYALILGGHISSVSAYNLAPPRAEVIPQTVNAGEEVKFIISIPLKPNLHLYGPNVKKPYFATKAVIEEQGPIIWQKTPILPKTSILNIMGENIEVITPNDKNNVNIIFEGTVKTSARPGKYIIKAFITYQACSEMSCMQPVVNKEVIATVRVGLQKASFRKQDNVSSKALEIKLFNHSVNLTNTNLVVALSIAFLAGLILNIMPCVLPIIPLKILQLAEQAKREKHSAVALSLMFSLGIIAFFLTIGIFAVVLKGSFSWGMQFQHAEFVFAMILLLLWLTLGMFGVFEIALPSFIANRPVMKSGYIGAFSMGFLGGILSTPCSFGILGAAVAWAQLQTAGITLLAFFAIGFGMAFPYIILSAFPAIAERIPKTGRWTELFKQSMGFLLLGVVAFLVNALPNENLFWFLLYFVFFSFVIWIWGCALSNRKGIIAVFVKIFLVIMLIYTGYLLFNSPNATSMGQNFTKNEVGTFTENSLQRELEKGKIVAVKFTANWCISCKVVEARVYHNPKILKLIEKGVLVVLKADLTRENPFLLKKLKEWTGQSGVPFTVLFFPNGKKKLFPGKFAPDELIRAISSFERLLDSRP